MDRNEPHTRLTHMTAFLACVARFCVVHEVRNPPNSGAPFASVCVCVVRCTVFVSPCSCAWGGSACARVGSFGALHVRVPGLQVHSVASARPVGLTATARVAGAGDHMFASCTPEQAGAAAGEKSAWARTCLPGGGGERRGIDRCGAGCSPAAVRWTLLLSHTITYNRA
jgi:hypothetical protein